MIIPSKEIFSKNYIGISSLLMNIFAGMASLQSRNFDFDRKIALGNGYALQWMLYFYTHTTSSTDHKFSLFFARPVQNPGKPPSHSPPKVVLWEKLAYNKMEYAKKYKEDPP